MRDDENQPGVTRPVAGSLEGEKHFLFLSHAGVDSEAALRLAKRLEDSPEARQRGLKVWIDKVDLGAGGRWKDALQAGLADSTAFAVYVGSRGVVNWVWDEVSVALDRAHAEPAYPLVPILAPGHDARRSAELPLAISGRRRHGAPRRVQKLLRAVLRLDPRAGVAAERDPFVGLQAYDSSKAHLFFGRDEGDRRAGRAAARRAAAHGHGRQRLGQVLAGARGPGARLPRRPPRPAARRGSRRDDLARGRDPPRHRPFGRLADSVREVAERTGDHATEASDLADLVRTRQPDKVRDAVLSGAPKDPERPSKILVVVDQFEEFRTSPRRSRLCRGPAPPRHARRRPHPRRADHAARLLLHLRQRSRNSSDACIGQTSPQSRYLAPPYVARGLARGHHRALATSPAVDERDREDLARAVLKDVGDEPGELALLQMALWRTLGRGQGPRPGPGACLW